MIKGVATAWISRIAVGIVCAVVALAWVPGVAGEAALGKTANPAQGPRDGWVTQYDIRDLTATFDIVEPGVDAGQGFVDAHRDEGSGQQELFVDLAQTRAIVCDPGTPAEPADDFAATAFVSFQQQSFTIQSLSINPGFQHGLLKAQVEGTVSADAPCAVSFPDLGPRSLGIRLDLRPTDKPGTTVETGTTMDADGLPLAFRVTSTTTNADGRLVLDGVAHDAAGRMTHEIAELRHLTP